MTHAPTFAFGPYLLIPNRQLLLSHGRAVRIGGRALDLLTAFVTRPGQLLTKRELLEEAWPRTTVVEGNLKVHIAALRRALDDEAESSTYIATVTGRGYRFIAPVETGEALTALAAADNPQPLTGEVQLRSAGPAPGRFEQTVASLAQAMRSLVVDLPVEAGSEVAGPSTRRVLFIEFSERDQDWIEDLFAQRLRVISATRSASRIPGGGER